MKDLLAKEIELNKVYLSDCVEFMQRIPDGVISLGIADPPYLSTANDRLKYTRMSEFPKKEYLDWSEQWISEMSRILSDRGSFYLFGGHVIFDLYLIVCKWLVYQAHISWIKKNRLVTTPQLKNWFPKCEIILFFTKQATGYTWNPIVKKYGIMESSNFQIIPNITKQMKEGVLHPTQKPLALISKFIEASSNEEDVVFDPFVGSGTTVVAAKRLGRLFLGCDNNAECIDLANKRLQDCLK